MAKNPTRKAYTGSGSDRPEPKAKTLPVKIDTEKSVQRLADAEQVPIFEIDGKVYTMSSAQRSDVALNFIEKMSTEGADKAAHYLLTTTLGKKGYKALLGVEGLSDDDFQGVLVRVQNVVLPKGQGGNRKSRRG